MDAILADTSAGHDDVVADAGLLLVTGLAVEVGGHERRGSAVDQGLAGEALVEDDRAVDGGNSALVAAVFDTLDHPFEYPARMQQALRKRLVEERRREAEDVGVKNQPRSHTGADPVAVDADNSGQGAAVRIESARRIVRFDLEDDTPVIVEGDDAGVVLENGEAVILLPLGGSHVLGCLHDTALEQRIDCFAIAPFILVVDAGREDLVLAVFAPGLGQSFEFGVGRLWSETLFAARRHDLRIAEMRPNRFHLLEGQGQHPLAADAHQLLIRNVEIDRIHTGLRVAGGNLRHHSGQAFLGVEFVA